MSIRFLKRAAVVVFLWGSASCFAQEVAPSRFEVVPPLLDKMTAGAGTDGTPEPAPVQAVPETDSAHEAGTIE